LKETLPWSLKKAARHIPALFYVASELLNICDHRIQGRNEGDKGGTIPRPVNDCGERRQIPTMYFLQYCTFASERPQVRTWGRQTYFLPLATAIQLRNIIKIAKVRKVTSDILRRSFYFQQSVLAWGLTDGHVIMLSDSHGCVLSGFALILQLRHNRTGIQRSQSM